MRINGSFVALAGALLFLPLVELAVQQLKKNGHLSPVAVAAHFTGTGCKGGIDPKYPGSDCRTLYTHNDDGGDQKIDVQKVKSVQFVGPVRRDKAGNALFAIWRSSPFTGEKLPQ